VLVMRFFHRGLIIGIQRGIAKKFRKEKRQLFVAPFSRLLLLQKDPQLKTGESFPRNFFIR